MKTKILIINYGPKPLPPVLGGGVETLVQLLIEGIGDNCELSVASAFSQEAKDASLKYPKVKFYYLNLKSFKYKLQLLFYYIFNHFLGVDIGNALCNLVKNTLDVRQYDIIISENGIRLGKSLRRCFDKKLILHLHNDWLNVLTKNAPLYKKSFDEIWTISAFLKQRVDEIEGETVTKVLYNGVDTNLFNPSKIRSRNILRSRYGIDDKDIVIANCCRIVEEKGVLQTIESFKKAKLQCCDYKLRLLIIGDISTDTPYIREIRHYNSPDIIFTGYVSHDELPYVMGCADIGIASTIHLNNKYGKHGYEGVIECFNLTVIEFLALGIPVIATNSGGMPEILMNEFNDTLIDANEANFVSRLTDKILEMICRIKHENINGKCLRLANKFSNDNYIKQFNNYISDNGDKM